MSFNRGGGGPAPPGGKFANRNLNAAVPTGAKGASARGPAKARGNLLFIQSDSKRVAKPIGIAAAPAPVALNTPSIRKENNGKDVSVTLVPVGVSSVWGQADNESKKDESLAEQQQLAQLQAQAVQPHAPSIAPWAKKDTDGTGAPVSSPPPSASKMRNWADIEEDEDNHESSGNSGMSFRGEEHRYPPTHAERAPPARPYGYPSQDGRFSGDARAMATGPGAGPPLDRGRMQPRSGSGDFGVHGGGPGYGRDGPPVGSRGGDYPLQHPPSGPAQQQQQQRAQGPPGPQGAEPRDMDKLVVEQAHAERMLIEQRKRRAEEERQRAGEYQHHDSMASERDGGYDRAVYEREAGYANSGMGSTTWNGLQQQQQQQQQYQREQFARPTRSPYESMSGPPAAPAHKVYSLSEVDAPRNAPVDPALAPRRRELYDPVQGKMVEVGDDPKKALKAAQRAGAGVGLGAVSGRGRDDGEAERKKVSAVGEKETPTLLQRPKPAPEAEEKAKSPPPKKAWGDIKPVTAVPIDALVEPLAQGKTAAFASKAGAPNKQRGTERDGSASNEEKTARANEARKRGPRTKGFLFKMDPVTRQLVQVLTPGEAALPVPPPESAGFASLLAGVGAAAGADAGASGGRGKKGAKGPDAAATTNAAAAAAAAAADADGKRGKTRGGKKGGKDELPQQGAFPPNKGLVAGMSSLTVGSGSGAGAARGSGSLSLMGLRGLDDDANASLSMLGGGLGGFGGLGGLGSFSDMGSGLGLGSGSGLGSGLGSSLGAGLGLQLGSGLGMSDDLSGYLQGSSLLGGTMVDLDLYGAASCLGDDGDGAGLGLLGRSRNANAANGAGDDDSDDDEDDDGEAKGRGGRPRSGRRGTRGVRGRGGRGNKNGSKGAVKGPPAAAV